MTAMIQWYKKWNQDNEDLLMFIGILLIGLIFAFIIIWLIKCFAHSLVDDIGIDPFAGVSTILIGFFSLVILKRQTKIIEKQTEIAERQNTITQNQLEIESNCKLIIDYVDQKISCTNGGNSSIENLIIYQLKFDSSTLLEVKKVEYLPIGVIFSDLLSIENDSSLVFLYQNGYSSKIHVIIKHYLRSIRDSGLLLMPYGCSNHLNNEFEIQIYNNINKIKSIKEAQNYLLSLDISR